MEYKCLQCKKNYASYKSLWNHNDKFHKMDISIKLVNHVTNVSQKLVKNEFKCKFCVNTYKHCSSKSKHEKICKLKKDETKTDDKIKELENKNNIMEAEIEKLKDLLQKSLKIHPKTLTKINKQLNNNNNGIINNNIYVQLGRENLSDILSSKEKIGILNRQAMGLNDLIELVHASGKYKQFMNVCITNLQNTIAYKFDEKANSFIAVNKNELLNDLVDSRVYDIEKFFEEYQTKFEPKKVEQIKKFIERMSNEEDSLKCIKKEEIKLILYNNLEKIKSNETVMIKINDKEIDV